MVNNIEVEIKKMLIAEPVKLDRNEIRSMIKSSVMKLGPSVSSEEKKRYAKVLLDIFGNGLTPKEAMNFSDKDMSFIYGFAHSQFHAGHYDKACELFKMLSLLEPLDSQLNLSLGVCFHRLKEYRKALSAYIGAFALDPKDPKDPLPLFYAYDCCLNLHVPDMAANMLRKVIQLAGENPAYATMKARAQLLLDGLSNQSSSSLGNIELPPQPS